MKLLDSPTFLKKGFLFSLILAFLFIISKNGLREVFFPTLPAEDGTFFFQIFYNEHELHHIFRFYSGYISVLPHLIAYLLAFLPVVWIPSAFALVSLLITAIALALFHKLAMLFWRNPLFAIYSVAIISALPLGDSWIVGTLAYQSWNFILILFIAILLPFPKNKFQRIPYILFFHLAIWSHPLSALIIPPLLYKIIKANEERLNRALFCLSGTAYYFFGTSGGNLSAFNPLETLQIFFIRVTAESAIGPVNRMDWAQAGYDASLLILGIILTVLLGILLAKHWKEKTQAEKNALATLVFFLVTSAAIAFIFRVQSRGLGMDYISAVWGVQYSYLSKIIFIFLSIIALKPVIWKEGIRLRLHLCAIVLLIVFNSNGKDVYKTREDNGRTIIKFVQLIERNFPNCRPGEQKLVTLKKGDKPSIGATRNFDIAIDICAPLK